MVRSFDPYGTIGAGAGVLADRLVGDPPHRFDAMGAYERTVARTQGAADAKAKATAVAAAAVVSGLGTGIGWGIRRVSGRLGAAAVVGWSAVHGRTRTRRARALAAALSSGDAVAARSLLPSMVTAEAERVDDDELATLAVATTAEELVDGVVGPGLAVAAFGAPGALAYRGLNALDAVLGHHGEHHERAGVVGSAVDTAANLVPSLTAAALVALVRPSRAGLVVSSVRRDAWCHPSPSVGVIEAAFAGALGVRLLDGRGVDNARRAEPADVAEAACLAEQVALAFGAVLTAIGAAGLLLARRRVAGTAGT